MLEREVGPILAHLADIAMLYLSSFSAAGQEHCGMDCRYAAFISISFALRISKPLTWTMHFPLICCLREYSGQWIVYGDILRARGDRIPQVNPAEHVGVNEDEEKSGKGKKQNDEKICFRGE